MMASATVPKADTRAAQISGFVESLQEPDRPYISPARFSKALGVNISAMARFTGVHRNTMRNPTSERVQERMREMIKVISAATELTGDLMKAIFWFRNEPIADHRHQTPAELVAKGHAEAVITYLRDLENGANGYEAALVKCKHEHGRLTDPLTQTLLDDFVTLKHELSVALKLLIRAISGTFHDHQWVSHRRLVLLFIPDRRPKVGAFKVHSWRISATRVETLNVASTNPVYKGGMDEKLFLYIDILGFSDIVENGERIDALFAEIDRLNVHTDSGFRTIVFSDTILVCANDGWMGSTEGQRSAVMWLVEFAQDLFYRLLHLDMHFRAYLTRGNFFHRHREHFESFHGKALVDCYLKEKAIQAMGVFMANSLVPLSHVFKVTPYDDDCSFVHVMQTLDSVSFNGEAYPLDPTHVQGMDLEWQLAEDVLYLSNIHRHMNDGALPEPVRQKYAATWALIQSRHTTLLEVLVAADFEPAAIGKSPLWHHAGARAADPDCELPEE